MQRYIFFTVVLSIAFAAPAWSQQRGERFEKYRYLIETTNAIYDITSRSVEPKPAELAEIAARSCNALKQLLADNDFNADLQAMAKAAPEHKEEHEHMRRDLTLFLDSFLKPESGLMAQAGLSGSAVFQVATAASFLSTQALGEPMDPQKVLAAIETLHRELCSAAVTLTKSQEEAREKSENHRRWKKRALGMGGVVLIVVDAASSAPTGGLGTASFTLGGAMVGAAVAD
jgi:hypothetical protein